MMIDTMAKLIICAYTALILSCSYANYTDGNVKASGFSVGTNRALEGFQYQKGGETTQLQIKGLEQNQTDGIKAASEALGTIVGTAIKAAAGKP